MILATDGDLNVGEILLYRFDTGGQKVLVEEMGGTLFTVAKDVKRRSNLTRYILRDIG